MAHDVFISYASQDKTVANAVCASLEQAKIRCWIAPRDIRSGENWAEAITKAIKKSRVMVLLFTESSNQSKQVAKELTLAVNSEVIVVPFKIDETLPSGLMEYYLSDTHWLDAMNPPTEKQVEQLVETVQHVLSEKETTLPPPEEESAVVAESIPVDETEKTEPSKVSAKKKNQGVLAASIVAAALLLLGGLYIAGVLPADQREVAVGDVEVEDEKIENDEAVEEEDKIIVTSTEDSGAGTLRWALQTARMGDVIIFDSTAFPPDNPASIYIKTKLPELAQGKITIDASNAGVIIDASYAEDDYVHGIIINSSNNVIMGLQILNCFSKRDDRQGAGIILYGRNNMIGGDRSKGSGPIGQGNLVANNCIGIDLPGTNSNNLLSGNLIGTDLDGTNPNYYGGNNDGIVMDGGANHNIIGPDNIIAYNYAVGIVVGFWHEDDHTTRHNTITANSIYQNGEKEILVQSAANGNIEPPVIISANLDGGTVRGTAAPGCKIELFSTSSTGGEIYEGFVETDENGRFIFSKGSPLWGPNITATATDPDGNTSEFSNPVSR